MRTIKRTSNPLSTLTKIGCLYMKNKIKFIKELIITIVIASLLNFIVTFVLSFILVNVGVPSDSIGYVANIGAAIWGIFVGYKVNTLLRESRQ